MKDQKNSLIPEDWKKVARKDFERVKRNLREGDIEASAFYLQQSLEKYMKGFLLQHGWSLRKIHELHDLLSDAVNYEPLLEKFRTLCERVSGYYIIERYPMPVPTELTCEDIEKDLEEAKGFIKAMFPEEDLNA